MLTIISGGSSGIGLQTCIDILRSDSKAFCAIVDVNEPDYSFFKKSIINRVKYFKCDVSNYNDSQICFKKIIMWNKEITNLVTCAAINIINPVISYSVKDWERVISINLTGTFIWCNLVTNHMVKNKNKGSVVTVSSIASHFGFEGRSAYTASKCGVIGLTKVLSNELSEKNIRVNCISPGFTETSLLKEKIQEGVIKRNDLLDKNAIKRIADPGEISNVILFLLDNNKSSYITGQNIFVDGGFINKKMD
tara:strand:- start:76 stop:825 length:750 start_codon:yes stop_codon:yes gene_type:complete